MCEIYRCLKYGPLTVNCVSMLFDWHKETTKKERKREREKRQLLLFVMSGKLRLGFVDDKGEDTTIRRYDVVV